MGLIRKLKCGVIVITHDESLIEKDDEIIRIER